MKRLLLILLLLPVSVEAQIITTIAGNDTCGYSGDNGLALEAHVNPTFSITADKFGNIYFSDYSNNVIRKINTSGIITTFAGTGIDNCSLEEGLATSIPISIPYCVTTDTFGNVYFNSGMSLIKKVDTSGNETNIVGNGVAGFSGDGGPATVASLYGNTGGGDFFKVADNGDIFIADFGNNRVRKASASSGIITTIAGTGVAGYNGDRISADTAELYLPLSLALDHLGNVFVGDQNNYRIRKIMPNGFIETIIGNGFACIGSGGENIHADSACINSLFCVATDDSNNIYICDQYYRTIRKINYSDSIVHTIVGGGSSLGDGGPPLLAEIYALGMVINKYGNIYIADFGNCRVREVKYNDELAQNFYIRNTNVNIFPNPATTQLTINAQNKINDIAIINLLGQTVYTNQYNSSQIQIDVATLPAGIYCVKINGSEVRKFVKQ